MVQKPMEERGENGRKHVEKKCWTKHTEYPREDVLENTIKLQEDMITISGNRAKSLGKWDSNQRKRCKNFPKMKETGKLLENYIKNE